MAKHKTRRAKTKKPATFQEATAAAAKAAKGVSKAIGKQKGRSVYIPAGKEYVIFDPKKEKVFIIFPDSKWPAELQNLVSEKISVAAKEAYMAGKNQKDELTTMRMHSPQESAGEALTAIRRHGISDQNKIVAIILSELAVSRQNQVAGLQHDIEQAENQLVNAVDMQKQFADIQQGKFVAL